MVPATRAATGEAVRSLLSTSNVTEPLDCAVDSSLRGPTGDPHFTTTLQLCSTLPHVERKSLDRRLFVLSHHIPAWSRWAPWVSDLGCRAHLREPLLM